MMARLEDEISLVSQVSSDAHYVRVGPSLCPMRVQCASEDMKSSHLPRVHCEQLGRALCVKADSPESICIVCQRFGFCAAISARNLCALDMLPTSFYPQTPSELLAFGPRFLARPMWLSSTLGLYLIDMLPSPPPFHSEHIYDNLQPRNSR